MSSPLRKIHEISDISSAHIRILKFIHQTPVLSSRSLNELFECELFFKCENFQKVGSFKYRGVSNFFEKRPFEEFQNGVITHSSGNHAQAVSHAAHIRGICATIVMPENSSKVKIDAVRSYGGNVVLCESALEARESTVQSLLEREKMLFIHPYDHVDIIEGQGTAALELLREIPNLDIVMAPIGGGGLMSGTSIAVKGVNPNIDVIGAEPEIANDAYLGIKSGKLYPPLSPNTIADGLRTGLSQLTFDVIKKNVDSILLAREEDIENAMMLIWHRMKIVIEPSSATPLACVMSENARNLKGKRIGIILSGGNVDLG